jgi:polysaccharide biosynthesis protein PelD
VDQGNAQQGSAKSGTDALTRHRFLPTRAGVIELVVLFAGLMVIERLLMTPGDFAKLQPHPYWLPVILLSLQYGTADGVLAAAIAIIASIVMGSPTQGVGEEYYRYLIRVWAVPIGWITSAILIGEIRARQRSQMTELRRDLKTSRSKAEDITRHCHRLEDKIQRLEREFATVEANSLDSLTASLEDLARGDADNWKNSLERAHRSLVGTGSISLVLRNDHTLAHVAHVSALSETAADLRQNQATLAPVLDAVIASRRTLNALRADDAVIVDGIAAMAAPLIAEPGGRVLGVLVLDAIAPERLTVDTENRLKLLAREIAHALALRGFDDLIEAAEPGPQSGRPDVERNSDADAAEAVPRRAGIFQRFGRA